MRSPSSASHTGRGTVTPVPDSFLPTSSALTSSETDGETVTDKENTCVCLFPTSAVSHPTLYQTRQHKQQMQVIRGMFASEMKMSDFFFILQSKALLKKHQLHNLNASSWNPPGTVPYSSANQRMQP